MSYSQRFKLASWGCALASSAGRESSSFSELKMYKYSSCWYGKEMHHNTQSMAFLARGTESERIVRDSTRAGSRACEGANIDAQNTSNSFPFLALSL